jgi:hypothetical protein
MQRMALLVFLFLSWLGSGVVLAQAGLKNYLPLHIGLRWDYDNGQGSTMRSTVQGPMTILGRETTVILHELTGPAAQDLRNFWSVDAESNLYLHGAENLSGGFVAVYDPPILWLDAPLFVGKSWTTSTKVYYDFAGTYPGDPIQVPLAVGEEVDLTVPAGTYHCFGTGSPVVLEALTASDGGRYDLLGLRYETEIAGRAEVDYNGWYADGVGQVRDVFPSYGIFDMTSWNGPVLTLCRSWGGIKSLYR